MITINRSKPVCEVGEEEEKREVCSFTYTQVNIIIIVIIIIIMIIIIINIMIIMGTIIIIITSIIITSDAFLCFCSF